MRSILILAYFSFTQAQAQQQQKKEPSPLYTPSPLIKKPVLLLPLEYYTPPLTQRQPQPMQQQEQKQQKPLYNTRLMVVLLAVILLWCMRFYLYRYIRSVTLRYNKEKEIYNVRSHDLYAVDVRRKDLWSLQATTYRRNGLNNISASSPV